LGNKGEGTSDYRAYDRNHTIQIEGKPDLYGSSDPTFRGDKSRHNPEDLLLAALSACHMMSFLHVCVNAGVIVTAYKDNATAEMLVNPDGSGHFTSVTLHPVVAVAKQEMTSNLDELHHKASKLCFIANSVNFPVRHEAACELTSDTGIRKNVSH
jgi:organic hydroperoxide reductase OsmC/OhrA